MHHLQQLAEGGEDTLKILLVFVQTIIKKIHFGENKVKLQEIL